MRAAVARHDALLRQAVADNGGYLFKTTGDGIAAAFAVASDGLGAALAAQQALLAEPWPEPVVLRSRMGLHTGTAELRDGDYFGPTLSRARAADGRGTRWAKSCSRTPHRNCAADSLPQDATLLLLGERRLKDLARPETIYQLLHPDLPAEFPPLRTLDNPDTPNNLPRQITSFVGREKEIEQVKALLAKTSLLTLAAAGGSGKTRLSLQVAADVLEQYPDGAWLVELAALSDPSARAADGRRCAWRQGTRRSEHHTDADRPPQAQAFAPRAGQLRASAHRPAPLSAAALLRACPHVMVLATSREPLGIGGETIYRVPSLSLPDPKTIEAATADSLSQFEAVRLFIERAQSVKPDFAATNANAPALAQLCYRLDGIPLAIELAAARVRSLTVEQINSKLDSRFRLLTGGDRSALPRQQTLRALIDWSYDLLGENEKTLLARLSVFAGGVGRLKRRSRSAGFDPVEDWEVLDLLTSLADKSLILSEETAGEQTTRYRMLETVRQYVAERLSEPVSDEETPVRARHVALFVALAEKSFPLLRGPKHVLWLNRLEAEHDNLRAALDACAQQVVQTTQFAGPTEPVAAVSAVSREAAISALSGLRLVGTLWQFWGVRGYLNEGRAQIARALARAAYGRASGRVGSSGRGGGEEGGG